jgi:hypothetical protein
VLGSLILGGYDQSRCEDGVSISMPGSANSSLVVGVQSITVTMNSRTGSNVYSTTSSSPGFFATIDSSLPYLSLPTAICDAFEALFMLTYDSATGFYLVNDTAFERNKAYQATVTIQLGDDTRASVQSVSIDLPYDAFDLVGSYPAFAQSTRYFPVRRAVNGINILGRTFLQETMLTVDYERRNFTVAQAKFSSPLPPAQIVAIKGPQSHNTNAKKGRMFVVVLPVALLAGLVVLAATLWWFRSRYANRHLHDRPCPVESNLAQEIASAPVSELQSPLSPQQDPAWCFEKELVIGPVELPASSVSRIDKAECEM